MPGERGRGRVDRDGFDLEERSRRITDHQLVAAGAHLVDAPVIGVVSRLVDQKGVDLLPSVIPTLLQDTPSRFTLLGTGDAAIAAELRALADTHRTRVSFIEGNAEALAFPDRSFDGYTIAFGIRNVPRIDLALKEAFRVLRPGGRFLCLEFSSVDVPGLDRLYDLFSFKVIPPLGRMVTGDAESYQYLVESIRKFPKPSAFADMIRAAGFSRVGWQTLSGGIVALHSGWRL